MGIDLEVITVSFLVLFKINLSLQGNGFWNNYIESQVEHPEILQRRRDLRGHANVLQSTGESSSAVLRRRNSDL